MITILLMNMTLSAAATQEEQLHLSEMTELECLEFVKSRGVPIPDDYEDETVWASFVKETIASCVYS